jgi:hypothetical protein
MPKEERGGREIDNGQFTIYNLENNPMVSQNAIPFFIIESKINIKRSLFDTVRCLY